MKKQGQTSKKTAKVLFSMLGVYAITYVLNSAAGGHWMNPSRDGNVRYKPELGGLSMSVAIMWQPRLGHNALGESDFLGVLYAPLISLDRALLHRTHYLTDSDFDTWLKQLTTSKVHPKFRENFVRERSKPAA